MIWRVHYYDNKVFTTKNTIPMVGLSLHIEQSKRAHQQTMTHAKRVKHFGKKGIHVKSWKQQGNETHTSLNPCISRTQNPLRVLCMIQVSGNTALSRQHCIQFVKHTLIPPTPVRTTCAQSYMMKQNLATT